MHLFFPPSIVYFFVSLPFKVQKGRGRKDYIHFCIDKDYTHLSVCKNYMYFYIDKGYTHFCVDKDYTHFCIDKYYTHFCIVGAPLALNLDNPWVLGI